MGTRNARGLGSVFYSETKKAWIAQVLVGYDEKGKPKYRQAQRKGQTDATNALKEMQQQTIQGVPQTGEGQKLSEYLDLWLAQTVKPNVEPKTYAFYEFNVRLHISPGLGHIRLTKLTSQHVQAMINDKAKTAVTDRKKKKEDDKKEAPKEEPKNEGETPAAKPEPKLLSPRSIQGIRATIRAALSVAWKQGLIRENPALRVSVPKMRHSEPIYLTAEQVAKLLPEIEDHYLENLFTIALLTGLRVGEATGLTWNDVNLTDKTIRVRGQLQRVDGKLIIKDLKSRSSRRVLAIPQSAVKALQEQRARQMMWKDTADDWNNELGLVFTTVEGRPLDPKTIDETLKRLCTDAKIPPVSFHKLRHTAATHMAAAGIPLHIVKDQLGHSQIALTSNTYAHAVPTALRDASDALEKSLNSAKQKEQTKT